MGTSIDIVLVTAPACHFCEDAKEILAELGSRMPLTVTMVDLHGDEGRDLAVAHRIPFPPLLLVNNRYFGYGRISKRKLEQHLSTLNITEAVT